MIQTYDELIFNVFISINAWPCFMHVHVSALCRHRQQKRPKSVKEKKTQSFFSKDKLRRFVWSRDPCIHRQGRYEGP